MLEVKVFAGSLNLTIDDSAFILLGNFLTILAPKNPNIFLPASDLLLEAISYDHFCECLCSDPNI